jgi:hypothetical protein
VNIVVAAIANVWGGTLKNYEFLQNGPQGVSTGKINMDNFNVDDIYSLSNTDKLALAFRQLVTSGFVGGSDEVAKIFNRVKGFSFKEKDGYGNPIGHPCYTPGEFKREFGSDYLKRFWRERERKRKVVLNTNRYSKVS